MSKKVFQWMLMASLIVGFGISVTSCSDDDDENISEEQKKEQAQQKLDTFWDVVGQLVSTDDYTEDYKNATFEPVYGMPDETNPLVRIVNTNDLETAAYRFATLVGISGVNASTKSCEWKNDDAGTMTYRQTNDGNSWAEVDVNIKQIPRLQKIIYRAPEQAGTNGTFPGTAYYRFGDVVKRTYKDKKDNNKQKEEYWVCVRPAFGPAGKEDSHWVSISQPSKSNIYEYTTDGGVHFGLPTGIGKNEEHMQNFAELLYAIVNSQDWGDNLQKLEKPKMWHDFKYERYAYNNCYFFMRVCNNWKDNNIFKYIFGYSETGDAAANKLRGELQKEGLNLLYKGYSWPWGWTLTLYGARFTNGVGKKANMHDLEYITYKKDVSGLANNELNLTASNYSSYPYLNSREFFGDDYSHYVIRHATGKELAGSKPDVYKKLGNGTNGVEDVYTYNNVQGITPGENTKPEADLTAKNVDSRYDGDYGFFYPGVIIQDDEGTRWFCIAGWYDLDGVFKSSDHKARFISLDGITTAQETYNGQTGSFISNSDLLPEKEAPLAAIMINRMALWADWQKITNEGHLAIKDKFKEIYGVDITTLGIQRDSTYTYKTNTLHANVDYTSVFYRPTGGRTAGTQPYLRFVHDITGMAPQRDNLEKYMRYPWARFYKKYNDGSNRLMDATHMFRNAGYITADQPVKADMWSNCYRHETTNRDGDFTYAKTYDVNFDWQLLHNNNTKYVSAYHEPIVAMRYLELDDPVGDQFRGTYNGKKYQLIYKLDNPGYEISVRFDLPGGIGSYHNWIDRTTQVPLKGCEMDNEPYELPYIAYSNVWDI